MKTKYSLLKKVIPLSLVLALTFSSYAFAASKKKDGDVNAQISNITNTLQMPSNPTAGSTISWTAQTVFDWSGMPNPYISSFSLRINAPQFSNPQITGSTGISNPVLTSTPYDSIINSIAWKYDSGSFWVITKTTKMISGTFRVQRDPYVATHSNWVGQLNKGYDSYGSDAWVYTTVN